MRALAGIDLGATAHQSLCDRAVSFARRAQATLDLVFVTQEVDEASRAALEARLSEVAALQIPANLRGEVKVFAGDPVEVLARESTNYDVVLVGPREPGAIERVFHGTIQERIMKVARCSLVVLRGEFDASAAPKLLVGIDIRSERSQEMLGAAADWARALGGTVDGVYIDSDVLPPIHNRRMHALARREMEAARKPVFQQVSAMMSRVEPDVRGVGLVEGGNPESVLVQLSRSYDLVVIGTRGRRGVAKYLLGSVPSFVLRRSGCSVLTIPTALDDEA